MERFKKEDIIGYIMIDGRKVTYLKEGIRTKQLEPIQDPDKLECHINEELVNYERYESFYRDILGLQDWSNED